MSAKRSVLIVDESAENREVLRVALQRRGATIFEADRARQGLRLLEQHRLDLIVLDIDAIIDRDATTDGDTTTDGADAMSPDLSQSAQASQIPILVLGTASRQSGNMSLGNRPTEEFISKPYHYGPLIRKIEGLLNQRSLV